MPVSGDTRQALKLLERIKLHLKDSEAAQLSPSVGDDLNTLISVLDSPVFHSILNIQDSLQELKRQLHKHPSILPVDFDISPTTGELLLNVPADPIPLQNSDSYEPSSDPDQNYGYDGHMTKTRVALKTDEMEPQSNEMSSIIVAPPQYVLSAITTESYAEEFQRTIDQGAQGRDIHTLQLFKPEGSSLGFSVVGLRSEQKGELGIFIQEIQPSGIAGRDKMIMDKFMEKIANADFPFCEEVSKYEKLAKIGQGTFGEVFKARHRITRKVVALKKVLMENEKEGFPITALREIKILQLLKHENVVNLIEICRTKPTPFNRSKSTFYLVFDFCEHDLAGLLSNVNVKFSLGEIKMVIKQLLNGLYFIHSNKILHRDMKAANILITKHGILKLADFGLARAFSVSKSGQPNRYTNRVVTLWYRPPELLLGERNYGPPIDMWGGGCIMAEMWTRSPIMQGATEQQQLNLISQLCGSINSETFPGVEKLELYNKLELIKGQKRRVKERLKAYVKDSFALDLLDKLLTIDPVKRIDSDTALNHDFFWSDPLPCDLTKMLSPHTQSMFEYLFSKKKNEQNRHGPGTGHNPRAHPTTNDGQYHDRVF